VAATSAGVTGGGAEILSNEVTRKASSWGNVHTLRRAPGSTFGG